jgi:hypothetical protein
VQFNLHDGKRCSEVMIASRARSECDSAKDMTCHSWIIPMHGEKKQLERSCTKLLGCISTQNARENQLPEYTVIFSSRARRGRGRRSRRVVVRHDCRPLASYFWSPSN